MMDDLGYGDVSLNGAIYDTPNIDRIGEEGVNLENFYSCYFFFLSKKQQQRYNNKPDNYKEQFFNAK